MGVISRKLYPACESMCVCCPALRSRSRQPVKRYKKLLAEIFSKSPEGNSNERKIVKLCEYASKNPLRIPKISKYLEERCYKELRSGNISHVGIVAEAFNKLLCICTEQMAYFAVDLLNVVRELLDESRHDAVLIIGCDTLTTFINCQVDGTYTHNIENFVDKVCTFARTTTDEHRKRALRAHNLRCLSAMVWFMAEVSYIFTELEKIVHATLDSYEIDSQNEEVEERRRSHHNWVDEVARSDRRGAPCVGEFSPAQIIIRTHPEKKAPCLLLRDEMETPKVWAQICVQKMVDLAKESTTMRRVLDPMFVYFDMKRQWAAPHGLAPILLSDMSSFVENPGHQQLIVACVIRHLEHKNVSHDPQMKCDIIRTATFLARQVRLEMVISDIGFVSDLFRHLRKSFVAATESASVGEHELNLNAHLQACIETCLLEIVKGIVDVRQLFDLMAITLEKLSPVRVVARAAIASVIILAHVISLASLSFQAQQVFPDALFIQLLKVMSHPDIEIRIGGHQIFYVLLIPSFAHAKNDTFKNPGRQPKNASTFSSITALLEKLRLEVYGTNAKHENEEDDCQQPNTADDEWKHGKSHKSSPNMHLISSIVDRTNGLANVTNFLQCNEDQMTQLLSALWIQVNLPDNLPANIEAIAQSFSLALTSFRSKNSNDTLILRFFQLPLSIQKIALDPNHGSLPPAYRRSLLVLSAAMVMFAARLYHVSETRDLLNAMPESDVDPYIGIRDDFQVYAKSRSETRDYLDASDNEEALLTLVDLRDKAHVSEKIVLSILVEGLSTITKYEAEEIGKQLTEGFVPDETFMFSPQSMLGMNHFPCNGSHSFDGEFSGNSVVEDDDRTSISSSWVVGGSGCRSIGQVVESAMEVAAGEVCVSTSPLPYSVITNQCDTLGTHSRQKLSNWLLPLHHHHHHHHHPITNPSTTTTQKEEVNPPTIFFFWAGPNIFKNTRKLQTFS